MTAERASSSSTKLRKGGGQMKMSVGKISIGLDRPSKPCDRLLVTAEVILRNARDTHPGISQRIARTEAQRLTNVRLCLFGATDVNLTESDSGMGCGKISIQRQSVLAFGDALCGALGVYLDKPQHHMAARMIRDRGQGFGQLRFGFGEGRDGIGDKEK